MKRRIELLEKELRILKKLWLDTKVIATAYTNDPVKDN